MGPHFINNPPGPLGFESKPGVGLGGTPNVRSGGPGLRPEMNQTHPSIRGYAPQGENEQIRPVVINSL